MDDDIKCDVCGGTGHVGDQCYLPLTIPKKNYYTMMSNAASYIPGVGVATKVYKFVTYIPSYVYRIFHKH